MSSMADQVVSKEQWLSSYQREYFRSQAESDPAIKADLLRNCLRQHHLARVAGWNPACSYPGANHLLQEEATKYAQVMDSAEGQEGLNNYAEAAVSLMQGKQTERREWKSSLSLEAGQGLKCVQKYLEIAKAAKNSLVHPSFEGKQLEDFKCSVPKQEARRPSSAATCQPVSKLKDGNQMTNMTNSFNSRVPGVPRSGNYSSSTNFNPGKNQSFLNQYGQSGMPAKTTSSIFGKPVGQDVGVNSRREQTGSLFQRSHNKSDETKQANALPGPYHNRFPAPAFNRQEANDRFTMGNEAEEETSTGFGAFRTAKEQLVIDQNKKNSHGQKNSSGSYGLNKRSLGTRRGLSSKFVPPVMNRDEDTGSSKMQRKPGELSMSRGGGDQTEDPALKNIDPKMVELIMNEIMDHGRPIGWDDIAGLEFAKATIKEIVVWPMLRPDIFTGLRGPPKGLLLFGPPGTGKTLIGKCIACQSKSTFFSISASSLTSKWVGEGEKMVRALFAVASMHQPAVIFIDEIDSLLSQRTDNEHEASRRIKTEFLVQLDGATTGSEDRILVVGATNRPKEIDEAARRRFVKRLYIPLPEREARKQIVVNLMKEQSHRLSEEELDRICHDSDGYSGADMANLCREAALGPIRSIDFSEIENISADQVRPITYQDFVAAFSNVRASVSANDLEAYLEWNKQYGSGGK